MSTSYIGWLRDANGLVILKNGKSLTVSSSHVNYQKILDSLKSKNFDRVESLMNVGETITKNSISKTNKNRRVYVKNGKVYFSPKSGEDKLLHGTLVKKILEDLDNGYEVDSLLKFLDNLLDNPKKETQDELYDFLTSGKIVITPDGHFLAYKRVMNNFLDIYTKTISNAPGKIVSMNRKEVDENRRNECSYGLHFCSLNYLSAYSYSGMGNDKIVIVKINPRDVVAIPTNYQFQKGRTCRYEVVGEYKGQMNEDAFNGNFISEKNKDVISKNVDWVVKPSSKQKNKSVKKESKQMQIKNKYSVAEGLVDYDGKLLVYRRWTGDFPQVAREDLDGRVRDAKTGRFIPKGSKTSRVTLKSFKDATRNVS